MSNIFQDNIPEELSKFKVNKEIPKIIERNILKALSYYPELKNVSIKFVFKQRIKKSIMQAQPVASTLIKNRKNRVYRINISSLFRLKHTVIPIHQIPDRVMIGWIGHELGHIMDYESRNLFKIITFGVAYLLSDNFVKAAERTADYFAINHGVGHYIVETKKFILENTDIPQAYKERIAKLYLSPDDIVEQVRLMEEKALR
jgi:hypothetical protein